MFEGKLHPRFLGPSPPAPAHHPFICAKVGLGVRDLWLVELRDPEGNLLALMCEKPRA